MTELLVDRLADGVWTAYAGGYRTLFADGGDSVVCVGTLGSRAGARALRDAIRAQMGKKPVGALVYAIDHLDHTGHGGELSPGEVIAHELCARVVSARAAPWQLPVTRPVAGDGDVLELDGLRLSLHYPCPTQGTGNLAVHLPDSGVLFVVGPQADARYGLFPDVHLEHLVRGWRALGRLDPAVVVPGRFALMDAAGLARACRYIESMQLVAQKAFAEMVPVWSLPAIEDEARERLRGEFGDLEGFDEHVGLTAMRVMHHYLMGGWGLEDTTRPELLLGR